CRRAPPPAAGGGQPVDPLRAPAPPRPEPRAARVEPRLAGSPPPQPAPIAERPAPASFFPEVSNFEGESRRPDQAELAEAEVSAAGGPNVSTDRRRPLAGVFIGVTLL